LLRGKDQAGRRQVLEREIGKVLLRLVLKMKRGRVPLGILSLFINADAHYCETPSVVFFALASYAAKHKLPVCEEVVVNGMVSPASIGITTPTSCELVAYDGSPGIHRGVTGPCISSSFIAADTDKI
jgi:hypothetical protein